MSTVLRDECGFDLVIFDLNDTLYSEKDYVRSGYIAAAPDKADELWQTFLDGKPASDVVMSERKPNKDFVAPKRLGMKAGWSRNEDGWY